MVAWRIYYGDLDPALLAHGARRCSRCGQHAIFDATDGGPEAAPPPGVQIIVSVDNRPLSDPHNVGRYMISGKHYYWLDEGEWWGGDTFGVFDYLSRPGFKVIKMGRSVVNERWRRVYDCAYADPDFAAKSAYRDGEYNPQKARRQDELAV